MNTLILAQGILTPSCSKTHVTYVFDITDDVSRLNIDFSYNPKLLEDKERSQEIISKCLGEYSRDKVPEDNWEDYLPIKNLLTLSVDGPDGFRGAAHRHPNEQKLFISREDASPGFIEGNIVQGQWCITLSVHAVVTETCTYKIHVWEGDDDHE